MYFDNDPTELIYSEKDATEANELLHAVQSVKNKNGDIIKYKREIISFVVYNFTARGKECVYNLEIDKELKVINRKGYPQPPLEIAAQVNPEDNSELIITIYYKSTHLDYIVQGIELIDVYNRHKNIAVGLIINKSRNKIIKAFKKEKELEIEVLKIIKKEPLNSINFLKNYYFKEEEIDFNKIVKTLLSRKEIKVSPKGDYESDSDLYYIITYLGEYRIA
jgi:hypothetical protein